MSPGRPDGNEALRTLFLVSFPPLWQNDPAASWVVPQGEASMKRMVLLALGLIVAQAWTLVAPAHAETMVWKFRSYHKNIVDVQLYASARNNVWPGNGRVWSLDDDDVHSVRINCVGGEKVC